MLDLYKNNLTKIGAQTFRGQYNLQGLTLATNSLMEISSSAFHHTPESRFLEPFGGPWRVVLTGH